MSTIFLKKYKVLQKIGEGSFSEVVKCQDRESGILYAAKRLKKIYQNMNEVLESTEVIAMRKISRHPNILYMVESHCDPLPGKVTLIFELMDMSLYDMMKARKGRIILEQKVKIYLYQLLKGLEHLHRHGIFHRDIKPENILLKGDVVKLADLGSICGIYSRPPYTEYISTRWYRSPECLLTTGFYGPKMDVWATGCVFYELLTLKPLFPGANEVDQITKIHAILGTPHSRVVAKFRRHKSRNCEYFFPSKAGSGVCNLLPQASETGRDILKLMLIYDPENRSNVKRLLDHRYFSDLRENESTRQLNTVTISNSSHDPHQWRNPVLLSYITSERRRKTKPLFIQKPKPRSNMTKTPRAVASSPNAMPNLLNKLSSSKMTWSDKSNVTIADDSKRLEETWVAGNVYSSRKLLGLLKIADTNAKNDLYEVSDGSNLKLPTVKYSSNTIASKGSGTSTPRSKSFLVKNDFSNYGSQYNFGGLDMMDHGCEDRVHSSDHRTINEEYHSYKSFLPYIVPHKFDGRYYGFPVGPTGSAPNQNYNAKPFTYSDSHRRTRLATIIEQPSPDINSRKISGQIKSPNTKSPAKKIAKHDISSSPNVRTVLPKKLKSSPRKIYDKRIRHDTK
ncbi:probable serine/threonine-protein kinase DDB_G0268078 isoform X2 [Cephus cinctus]|uniref:Probable serine/threonine-protein kinase DDB_G0268078 isoform X2 n=1 Tax=Cephus cinctus TaxID=211228 RepID=A0AAJ7FJ85_CEPCN|nr:probable serine/threonine-protein kinase DDB_G0268078 isoform X2 [Cephus cinctus]